MAWLLQNVTKAVDLTAAATASTVRGHHSAYGDVSTLAFTVDDVLGTIDIDEEDEFYLTDGGVKVFAGFAREVTKTDTGLSSQRQYAVTCQDYNTLLEDDVVNVPTVLPAGDSDADWITTIFAVFGTRGVAVGAEVQQLRASMPADLDVYGMTLREVMTEIAKVTGGSRFVDFDKQLHYFNSESLAAPFGLSDAPNDSTTFEYEDFSLPSLSVDYRNEVLVIGTAVAVTRYLGGVPPAAGTRRAGVIRDPAIEDEATANAVGDSYLASHSVMRQPGSLVTHKPGLRAGMNVQLTHAGWAIAAATYRIQSVEFNPQNKDRTRYTIRFGGAPVTLGEFFNRTAEQIQGIGGDIGAVRSSIVDLSVGGGNMIRNSSFEQGTDWTVDPNVFIGYDPVSPQEAFAGSKVTRIAGTGTLQLYNPVLIPVAPSDDWWFSVWRFIHVQAAGGSVEFVIGEYDSASALIGYKSHPSVASGTDSEWRRMMLHFAPSAGPGVDFVWNPATRFVRVHLQQVGAATHTVDFDAVQLERGKLLTAYAPAPYELLDGSITGAKIADLTVTLAKLAADSVDNTKLVTDAVTAVKIATNAITETKIAADAVTTPKIAASAVTADEIAASAVIAGKIAANAVTATEIAANAVTAAKVLAGEITAVKLASGSVETDKLAANAVTAGKIAADTITAAQIAANAVTANEIAANTITAAEIAANAITADELSAVTITSKTITIENGHLVLKNAGGTVIIDGTSNMFKILTTGTITGTWPAAGNVSQTSVQLTGLGTGWTTVPMNATQLTLDTLGSVRVAGGFQAAVDPFTGVVKYHAESQIFIASGSVWVALLRYSNTAAGSGSAGTRYYVQVEIGL